MKEFGKIPVRVKADQKYNSSGIRVNKNDKLEFTVNINQEWRDRQHKCGPMGWPTKKSKWWVRWRIKVLERYRR